MMGGDDKNNNGQRDDFQLFHRFCSLHCLLSSWKMSKVDPLELQMPCWFVSELPQASDSSVFRTIQIRGPSLWSEGCKNHFDMANQCTWFTLKQDNLERFLYDLVSLWGNTRLQVGWNFSFTIYNLEYCEVEELFWRFRTPKLVA